MGQFLIHCWWIPQPCTPVEFNTAGINRGKRAGNFRQLVFSILLHSSRFQIAIS